MVVLGCSGLAGMLPEVPRCFGGTLANLLTPGVVSVVESVGGVILANGPLDLIFGINSSGTAFADHPFETACMDCQNGTEMRVRDPYTTNRPVHYLFITNVVMFFSILPSFDIALMRVLSIRALEVGKNDSKILKIVRLHGLMQF